MIVSSMGLLRLCVNRGFIKLEGFVYATLAENISSSSDGSDSTPSDTN